MKRPKHSSKENSQIKKPIVIDEILQYDNNIALAFSNTIPLLFFLILCAFFIYLNSILWTINSSLTQEFSVSNTKVYLDELVSIGPRITGYSSNENLARDYLLKHLKRTKSDIPSEIEFEIDIQHPTGSFHHFQFLHGFHNVYSNVTNIIVRISSCSRQNDIAYMNSSVLVNAHFDRYMSFYTNYLLFLNLWVFIVL